MTAAAPRMAMIALLLMVFSASAPAHAHPFRTGIYGHRVTVELRADTVVVDALFEEPTPRVLAEYRVWADGQAGAPTEVMARHTALRLDELVQGISVTVDGSPVVLERREIDGRNGVGGADFVRYRLRLQATAPAGYRSVNIVDEAHREEQLATRWDIVMAEGLRLDASSLWGERGRDGSGQWTADGTEARELRLGVTPLGPATRGFVRLGEVLLGDRERRSDGLLDGRQCRAAVLTPLRNRALAVVLGPLLLILVGWAVRRSWADRLDR